MAFPQVMPILACLEWEIHTQFLRLVLPRDATHPYLVSRVYSLSFPGTVFKHIQILEMMSEVQPFGKYQSFTHKNEF